MSNDEEEYRPRLKPVMPKAPDLHTLLDENGRPRRPTRASRRMKFLHLQERTHSLGTHTGDSDDPYDLARGPFPRTRRPLESEWSEGIMSDEDAQTIKKVSTARKKINPNQKSLSKKRGRPKKSE